MPHMMDPEIRDTQDRLITYRQAAERLGMPVGTLYSLVSTRRIPHVRLGRRLVRFRRRELEAWVDEHRVDARGHR